MSALEDVSPGAKGGDFPFDSRAEASATEDPPGEFLVASVCADLSEQLPLLEEVSMTQAQRCSDGRDLTEGAWGPSFFFAEKKQKQSETRVANICFFPRWVLKGIDITSGNILLFFAGDLKQMEDGLGIGAIDLGREKPT